MAERERDNKIATAVTITQVTEWISKGHTRQYCINKLMEDGVTYSNANVIYYGALKELTPDQNLFDDYKRGVIQQNLDRLETIIDSSISGNTSEKMVALKAIDQLNKLCGAYGENNITIAQQNKDGDGQVIQIRFGE